jgi:hypothetical protein
MLLHRLKYDFIHAIFKCNVYLTTDKMFVDKLEALEAKLIAAKDEIRYRIPSANVIGLNSQNQTHYTSVGCDRPASFTNGAMEVQETAHQDAEQDRAYAEEDSDADAMDPYDILEDSASLAPSITG